MVLESVFPVCAEAAAVSPSGSLASSIFDPLSALVGASGGVYALMGGYFMNAVVVSAICLLAVYVSRFSKMTVTQ